METWTSKTGEDCFYLKCEDGNEHDKYTVVVIIAVQALSYSSKLHHQS